MQYYNAGHGCSQETILSLWFTWTSRTQFWIIVSTSTRRLHMSNVSDSSNPSEHSIVACSFDIPLIGVGQTGCAGGTYFPSSGFIDPARSSKSTTFSDDPVSARLCRRPEAPQTKLVSSTRTPLVHPAAPHVMLMKGDPSSPWSRPTHSQDGRMKVSLTQ